MMELKCGKAIEISHSSPGYEKKVLIDIYGSENRSGFNVQFEIDEEELKELIKMLQG